MREDALPCGWSTVQLADVTEVLDRHRVPVNADERATRVGTVPYYGATGQVGWIDDFIFDEELVLLGEDGAPFLEAHKPKAYLVHGKTWVNNHAHVLRGRGVSNAFLMHQLNVVDYHPFVSGTTRQKLPQAPMRSIPLSLPPLAEQHRIVGAIEEQLTRLDAAVAALERVRANLRRYRSAVLDAACTGRLVPTEAALSLNASRDYERARCMLERKGITGEECDVPGWATACVGALAAKIDYGTSSRSSEAGAVPVIRMGNIVDGRLIFDDLKFLPADHHEFPKLLLEPGDLLFNRTNSADLVGKSAVFSGTRRPCSFASYLIRVRLTESLRPELLAYYLNSPRGRNWIRSVVSQQVGQANVNGSKLRSLSVPVPPAAEQPRIVAEVERRLSLADKLEAVSNVALKRAAALRRSILKRAFEGKLVPQDPDDEPASVLLERIRAERTAQAPNGASPKRRVRARAQR